jgi:hypothetical protein
LYRVVTDDPAMDQIAALPTEALPYYAQALVILELVPWNGLPYNEKYPDRPLRELNFGADHQGKVTYLILEDQQRVDVLVVQWLG